MDNAPKLSVMINYELEKMNNIKNAFDTFAKHLEAIDSCVKVIQKQGLNIRIPKDIEFDFSLFYLESIQSSRRSDKPFKFHDIQNKIIGVSVYLQKAIIEKTGKGVLEHEIPGIVNVKNQTSQSINSLID